MTFDYPKVDHRVFDVIINNRYKVQDKVITSYKRKNRNCITYVVQFGRRDSRYCYGDNDYYWLFLPDKKGAYVIPETCLYENGMICGQNEPNKGSLMVILHPYKTDVSDLKYGFLNKHLYLFDHADTKQKIERLFCDQSKPEIPHFDEHFEFTIRHRFNSLDKEYVRNLVRDIFRNIVAENSVSNIFKNVVNKQSMQPKYCAMCQTLLGADNKSGYCEPCYPKMIVQTGKTRKVVRPPYEVLMEELRVSNFSQVGKKYGVSDNAIRKWIKTYEKYGTD
jgi:hypothetical protein